MNQYAVSNPYMKNSIETASPSKLLLMLFDGAIKYTKLAIQATEKNNVQDAHRYNVRVQDIFDELMATLDFSYPISKELYSLYEYMNYRMAEGNMKKDVAPLNEVLAFLLEYKAVWAETALKEKAHG
ncbi:flagellar export chaperone FliS [Brevibacillus nitrificans]|uniref:flagellar export chaperone FliS n=1 Tax=Brevibacillus nitrificans TaxID=651560 RepID=UPI00260359A3|nr:flagellar export chaperone FliS [Brevibacillus nitrificans]MED1791096.1 flagellar export chaperone FliS [Brevibacillus nitrificans]